MTTPTEDASAAPQAAQEQPLQEPPPLEQTARAPRMVSLKAVLFAAVALIVVAANVLVTIPIARWQDEAAALEAANREAGTALAGFEADMEEQDSFEALLTSQMTAVEARIAELEAVVTTNAGRADDIRVAVDRLNKCHDEQRALIDYLWTTGTQLYGTDRVADVKRQCDAARDAFKKAKAKVQADD